MASSVGSGAGLTLATLPSELQWLVLSYSSLVDLPALHRACSSFHCILCELLHPPRTERPSSSSPRSSCVSLLSSPLPPLAAAYHHARPLLTFLASDEPSCWRLFTSRDARLKATERYSCPPPLIRRLLRRFPSMRLSFRRKQSRSVERLWLVDNSLQAAALLPAALALLVARSVLPAGSAHRLPLPLLSSASGVLRSGWTSALLLAYVAALTACDADRAVRQRALADTATRPANAQHTQHHQQQHNEQMWSDNDSDSDEDVEEAEEREEEDEDEGAGHIDQRLAMVAGDQHRRRVRVDVDIAFQHRMLQSAEAVMRARERRSQRVERATAAAVAAGDRMAPAFGSATERTTAALAVSEARSTLRREDGSSLLVRLLNATVSAVRSELTYRHVLIVAVYASLAALSSLLRRFVLLDGVRLMVDGLIPAIPLLAIAHSVLNEMDAAPAPLARLLEQLHHPRVIVALRLIGLLATLAANTALYRPALVLYDRILMPAMEALTLRSLQLPRRSTNGNVRSLDWVSPFAIGSAAVASYSHSPLSFTRLFALSLFVSQLLSSDDSRCLDATRLTAGVSFFGSGALHRWLLSVALLHIRLSGGLCCSTAVHALLNCTAVITRKLSL